MRTLEGKVAIVTGASKGIGAAIARAYGAAGAAVIVNYATARDAADRVVADIVAKDGRAVAVQADVSRPAEIARLFAEAKRAFGTIDILVNNAGVYAFLALEEVTEAELHRHFATNVYGPILASQEASRHFGAKGGSIINISSVVARNPPPHTSVYSATKGALDTVTRALARELGPRNIRVNSVSPGGTETEGTQRAGLIGSDFEKQLIAQTPLGRFGQPDDIAKVAVFFASDASGWITGETIPVAGGY